MNKHQSGFSLVEITLALGIASFTLLAILGLLPVGLNSTYSALEQSQAANITSNIIADIQQTPVTSSTLTPASSIFGIMLPGPGSATTTTNQSIFITGNGTVTTQANARYRAVIKTNLSTIPSGHPSGGDSHFANVGTVEIYWPAAAPIANALGSTITFFAVDKN